MSIIAKAKVGSTASGLVTKGSDEDAVTIYYSGPQTFVHLDPSAAKWPKDRFTQHLGKDHTRIEFINLFKRGLKPSFEMAYILNTIEVLDPRFNIVVFRDCVETNLDWLSYGYRCLSFGNKINKPSAKQLLQHIYALSLYQYQLDRSTFCGPVDYTYLSPIVSEAYYWYDGMVEESLNPDQVYIDLLQTQLKCIETVSGLMSSLGHPDKAQKQYRYNRFMNLFLDYAIVHRYQGDYNE